jgi:hypothetical protein
MLGALSEHQSSRGSDLGMSGAAWTREGGVEDFCIMCRAKRRGKYQYSSEERCQEGGRRAKALRRRARGEFRLLGFAGSGVLVLVFF